MPMPLSVMSGVDAAASSMTSISRRSAGRWASSAGRRASSDQLAAVGGEESAVCLDDGVAGQQLGLGERRAQHAVAANVIEMPVAVDDRPHRLAAGTHAVEQGLHMRRMASGVDHDPAFGRVDQHAVAVGLSARDEAARQPFDAGRDDLRLRQRGAMTRQQQQPQPSTEKPRGHVRLHSCRGSTRDATAVQAAALSARGRRLGAR
jgi:hypothetical protein